MQSKFVVEDAIEEVDKAVTKAFDKAGKAVEKAGEAFDKAKEGAKAYVKNTHWRHPNMPSLRLYNPSQQQTLTDDDVKRSIQCIEKRFFEKHKQIAVLNDPMFTNEQLQARYEKLKEQLIQPLQDLPKGSIDPKSTSNQLKLITELGAHWRQGLKELDSIHQEQRVYARIQISNMPPQDAKEAQKEIKAMPEGNDAEKEAKHGAQVKLDNQMREKKLAEEKYQKLEFFQKAERRVCEQALGRAKGHFWDSLSQNREWSHQKGVSEWLQRGSDFESAREAAIMKKVAAQKEEEKKALENGQAASVGNESTADMKEKKPITVTEEEILAEMKTFKSGNMVYDFTKNQAGNDVITAKPKYLKNQPDQLGNMPAGADREAPKNEFEKLWNESKDNWSKFLRKENPKETVKELLDLGHARNYKNFTVTTESKAAAKQALVEMYVNEKNKEANLAAQKDPTSKAALSSTNPHTFEKLSLKAGKNGPTLNDWREVSQHQENGLLKGVTAKEIQELGDAQIKAALDKRVHIHDQVSSAARKDLRDESGKFAERYHDRVTVFNPKHKQPEEGFGEVRKLSSDPNAEAKSSIPEAPTSSGPK